VMRVAFAWAGNAVCSRCVLICENKKIQKIVAD
jgi:hypothetical protein